MPGSRRALLVALALGAAAPVGAQAPAGWTRVGEGVWLRDLRDTAARGVVVGFAGWTVQDAWAQAWVEALHASALGDSGIRFLYAVRGPRDAAYDARELGTAALASLLLRHADAPDIIMVAHSSGSFVAHAVLARLADISEGLGVLGRITYFDLDGGTSGLPERVVHRLRRLYFVYATDTTTGTSSANADDMREAGARLAHAGGAVEVRLGATGCRPGARWCVHDALVIERPHDPGGFDLERDYQRFAPDRPVSARYLAAPWRGTPTSVSR